MELFDSLIHGFGVALSPHNLMFALFGSILGTLVGILPGLGPASGIAILLTITTKFDATAAIIMLAAIYYGAMYGGSTTSILVNIPGEASSVVTCLDGYSLAKQGKAGIALSIAAISPSSLEHSACLVVFFAPFWLELPFHLSS